MNIRIGILGSILFMAYVSVDESSNIIPNNNKSSKAQME